MMKHHRCRCFCFFLRALTESETETTPHPPPPPNTHTSVFSPHPTANALWVMLELEHGTENLWMSLYTYMDDEDAF